MEVRTKNLPLGDASPAGEDADAGRLAARLLRPLLADDRFSANASAFLVVLAGEFRCTRASLGMFSGGTLQVRALSNHPHPVTRNVLPDVVGAMEEAVMQQASVLHPAPHEAFPQIVVAHAELARRRRAQSVVSIPLACGGRLIGAVTLESRERPITPKAVSTLETLLSDLSPLLELQWLREQPLRQRAARAMRAGLARWNERHPLRLKLVAAGMAAVLGALLFAVPIRGSVTAPARLEASVQRLITVPVDGYLKQVHVRPGDVVKAGSPLAELEDETLRAQRRRIESEVSQRENGLAEAMVRGDRVQIAMQQAKLEETLAQLQLTDQDLARAKLLAPFDGVVIQGDVKQLLGAPLKRGDTLLTLSQGSGFRVIVNVDERDLPELQAGQTGQLTLAAFPNERFDIRITRITPVAAAVDGVNSFEVEAQLGAEAAARLTPGLKGVAKLDEGAQPVGVKWAKRLWRRMSFLAWSFA